MSKTNGYDTVYAVDFYHSMTQIPGPLKDSSMYIDAYEKTLQLCPTKPTKERPFIVFDLCTGTGRIIQDLISAQAKQDKDLDATKFIGLDISPLMLEHAVKIPLASPTVDVTWIQGSALDLQAVPEFQDGSLKSDLLIVAFGTFSHFTELVQAAQFLREIAQVLQPGTGRAYISIRDVASTCESSPDANGQDDQGPDMPSLILPGITYRRIGTEVQVKDSVVYVISNVQVLGPDGKIVGTESATTAFRMWGNKEILTIASSIGLGFVETVKGEDEIHHVFQVA